MQCILLNVRIRNNLTYVPFYWISFPPLKPHIAKSIILAFTKIKYRFVEGKKKKWTAIHSQTELQVSHSQSGNPGESSRNLENIFKVLIRKWCLETYKRETYHNRNMLISKATVTSFFQKKVIFPISPLSWWERESLCLNDVNIILNFTLVT